jgi:hypothetical protein
MTNTHTHDVMVCEDCYTAHHYGCRQIEREATADEEHAWHGGYLRGHALPNVVEETDNGLQIREWFAGESDTPSDREPLALLAGFDLADNVDSDTGDGIDTFSSSRCHGCGSTLGGTRYRLAIFEVTS